MKKDPQIVSGQALVGEELALLPADIIIEDGTITAIEENPRAPPVWICPAFFNAHTHLGDTVAMDCGATGDLAALVTPPDGLKHRLLAAASRQDLVAGMRASIEGMIAGGTAGCADFREGGTDGVTALQDAARRPSLPCRASSGVTAARRLPAALGSAAPAMFPVSNGSWPRRGGPGRRSRSMPVSGMPGMSMLHSHSTRTSSSTRPMQQKNSSGTVRSRRSPLRSAPGPTGRSASHHPARHPPLRLMEELGCTVCLGTDNVMFVPPDMFGEMAFVSTVYGTDPAAILRSAVGGSALGGSPFFIGQGARANLFMINPEKTALHFSRDPVASIIKRASFALNRHKCF